MKVLEAMSLALRSALLEIKNMCTDAQNHILIISCDTLNEPSCKDVRRNPGAQDPFAPAVKTQQDPHWMYSPLDLV